MLVLAVCYGANSLGATLDAQSCEMSLLRSELAVMRAELGQVTIALNKKGQGAEGHRRPLPLLVRAVLVSPDVPSRGT